MKLPDYYKQTGCCLVCEDRICNGEKFREEKLWCLDCKCRDCKWREFYPELGRGVCILNVNEFDKVLMDCGLIPVFV